MRRRTPRDDTPCPDALLDLRLDDWHPDDLAASIAEWSAARQQWATDHPDSRRLGGHVNRIRYQRH
ncbi:MAG: hypothetical protein ACR2JO_09915, partial [Mycobacteriales bacterium]